MKQHVISGKVIYKSLVAQGQADVNLKTSEGEIGIRIAQAGDFSDGEVRSFVMNTFIGEEFCLYLVDGQVKELINYSKDKVLILDKYPQLGVSFRESAFVTVQGRFENALLVDEPELLLLRLLVCGRISAYSIVAGKEKMKKLLSSLQNCKKKDLLQLKILPDGKVFHIVNQTQVFEVAC